MVVGHDHGVLVDQRRHEPSVGADEGAGLFPEAGEYPIEQQGESDHESQADKVVARIVDDDVGQLLPADDVAEERVADEQREAEEDDVF